MATVSAVINTLNESNNIKLCLESLRWCDEIIVVDMYSDDDTVKIASQYTDKIYYHEKMGYVEPARKFAVDKASGDWIVIIDADELIPVELKKQLVSIADKNDIDVVYMPRKNYIVGDWIRYTGWWPDYQPRFFKSGKINFSDNIHSEFEINRDARKLYLSATGQNGIEHFAYLGSEHFLSKLNRYTTIEAKQYYDQGKSFSLFRMLVAGFRGFQVRYINNKGYKDGYRGLFLSLMMGFYRTLNYIKLWEYWQNKDVPVEVTYNMLKEKIVNEYSE